MSLIKSDGLIRQFLSTNGDGTGDFNVIGNYGTPTSFYIQPPSDERYVIDRMLVYIQDVGSFSTTTYANATILTNGLVFCVSDDSGVLHNLTTGVPIKTNPNWATHCYNSILIQYPGGGTVRALSVEWIFSNAGFPLLLEGKSNTKFELIVQDDFSLIDAHYFKVEGYKL